MPPLEQLSRSLLEVSSTPASFEVDVSTTAGLSFEGARKIPDLSLRGRPHLQVRSQQRSSSASTRSESTPPKERDGRVPRQIIVDSFAPRVTCYASTDADELIKLKGFNTGLRELLCSFGERVQGKVIIRDSLGVGREWEDFGVRFIDPSSLQHVQTLEGSSQESLSSRPLSTQTSFETLDPAALIDKIIQSHLESQDGCSDADDPHVYDFSIGSQRSGRNDDEPLYSFYLRKLLSSTHIVPYETFSHPIACIIAVSSRNEDPIDSLRRLYESSSHERNNIPTWVNTDYLRYYVLIHDEENDDITKSTALFDLMKRHFGLHCHLLRLRSSRCVPTDDDSFQVPSCEWLSANEEMDRLHRIDHIDVENDEIYIHESDATAVKGFIREMVAQSLIPFMEGRVTTWNDQVASRRRGIGARFMSLSKRITSFGSNKATPAGLSESPGSPGNNFDSLRGFYSPETSEAILRQLGDHAFMLRDWKLANATYELVRTDFGNDKAWKHHAAATEMCAISSLLAPHSMSSRSKYEMIDQLLNAATYSYLTRSSMSFGTIRCLSIAVELLKGCGASGAVDAARWGGKLLELRVMTLIPQAFLSERIASCYRSRNGTGLLATGSRRRQAALWDLLSSATWMHQGTVSRAQDRLRLASTIYRDPDHSWGSMPFPSMQYFWGSLEQAIHFYGPSYPVSMH